MTTRIFIVAALALTACAGRQDKVSRTTTTSATSAWVPNGIELYVARQDLRPCPNDLTPRVDFDPGIAALRPEELVGLDQWARCLRQPDMKHMTVVLVEPAVDAAPLTVDRARTVKSALVARGIDPARVVVAGREAGGTSDVLRLEVTSTTSMRELAAPDPQVRPGIR